MIDTKKLRELADSYAKARMDYTDSEPDGWASERDELFKELDRVTAERDALKEDEVLMRDVFDAYENGVGMIAAINAIRQRLETKT